MVLLGILDVVGHLVLEAFMWYASLITSHLPPPFFFFQLGDIVQQILNIYEAGCPTKKRRRRGKLGLILVTGLLDEVSGKFAVWF